MKCRVGIDRRTIACCHMESEGMSEGKPTISSDRNQASEAAITQRSNEDLLSRATGGANVEATNKTGHDAAWDRVTSRMRNDIGETAWRNWIKPLRFGRLEDGRGVCLYARPLCESAATARETAVGRPSR